MNLTRILNQRRQRRNARKIYFGFEENPRTDTARTTLRHETDPGQRVHALAYLIERELGLYRTHDNAFGFTPWPGDHAGDAATGLAYGVMILRMLRAVETARREHHHWWRTHWTPTAWGERALADTEESLAAACDLILGQLTTETDPTETAVLYERLWIAAYPVIGGQAAEWIASIGNDWQCRAAGVIDGPDTVLIVPNDRRGDVQFLPAID